MARGISSGIERQINNKTSEVEKQMDQQAKTWKDLRNRIDTILMVNNIIKGNDLRLRCLALDSMTMEERKAHITAHWGPQYMTKVLPLLQQLETLERHIAKSQE